MTCPLKRPMTICQDLNGFFWGMKDDDKPCCRCSEYANSATAVLMATMLDEPCKFGCNHVGSCNKEEMIECQSGPSSAGQVLV